jgi:hypothetical protein
MKALYLLTWMGLVGLALSANAQTPTKRLYLGPALTVDHFSSRPQTNAPSDIRYATAFSYGIDLSYLTGRILFDAHLLTAQRSYDLRTNIQALELNDPLLLSKVRLSTRSYSLPIGISYRFITGHRVQVLAGVGALAEWMPGSFSRESYNLVGQPSTATLADPVTTKSFALGGRFQAQVRYHLSERIVVQLEPAVHFFPRVQTPYISGNKTGLGALLSLGYALF